MSKTRVVHVNDNVPGAIYIGRRVNRKGLKASKWANPYAMKNHRDPDQRAYVIELYRSELTTGGRSKLNDLHELAGKPLACWCRHDGEERTADNACHGDVLVALIQELGLERETTNDQ